MVEDEIIQLILEKDERGIELLKSNYESMIRYIVSNILINEQDTDECINDIYFQLWSKIQLYNKSISKLSTWITSISRNAALNYLKKKKNLTCDIDEHIVSSPSPEVFLLKKEQSSYIKKQYHVYRVQKSIYSTENIITSSQPIKSQLC